MAKQFIGMTKEGDKRAADKLLQLLVLCLVSFSIAVVYCILKKCDPPFQFRHLRICIGEVAQLSNI